MSVSVRPFVGRAHELAALEQAGIDAEAGGGSLWLVVGEPGIGKSRLVEELARRLETRGLLVAWGRAWEAGGAPAFWPWIQVLRTILRRRGAEALDPDRSDVLAQLLPELGRDADGGSAAPNLAPEEARFRLLDAVVALLIDAAEGGPLCILLEDLHAADPSSLLLLELLATHVRTAPLIVIGSHRDVAAAGSSTGDHLLRLGRTARQLPLRRLEKGDVDAFVRAVLPHEPPSALVDRVHAASEGNPLFLVELSRWMDGRSALPAEGEPLAAPGTVRALIQARLSSVPASTRPLLEVAAVLGRESSLSVLAEASDEGRGQVEQALAEIAPTGVLELLGADQLRFSHGLVRDVLYTSISDEERQTLHLRCADACLARSTGSEPPWSELAHHLLLAGPRGHDRAVEAAVCAGELALDQLAFDEAAEWLSRALEHLETGAPVAPLRRAELLLALGHARMLAGDVTTGRALCSEVAAVARQAGAVPLLARAALEYGAIFLYGVIDDTLVGLLREAHDALGDREPALRARVLARLAAALQPAPDPSGPIDMARAAIDLARGLGDPAVLLDVMRSAGSAFADLAVPQERRELDREHLTLAERLGDTAEVLRGGQRLVLDALELGDLAEASAVVGICEQAAQQLGVPHALWRAAGLRTMVLLFEGRFDEAEVAATRAENLVAQARDPNARGALELQHVLSLSLRGHDEDALAAASALRVAMDTSEFHRMFLDALCAALRARVGQLGIAALSDLADVAIASGDPSVLACATELALASEDGPTAERLLERLRPMARRFVNWGMVGMFVGAPVPWLVARLESSLGRDAAARGSFDAALAQAEAAGARPWKVWAALDHARHLARVAPEETAGRRELLQTALATAKELGLDLLSSTITAELTEASGGTRREPATSPPPEPAAEAIPTAEEGPRLRLRRLGDVWEIASANGVVHLRDTKGLRMLSRMLEAPGRAFHVLELAGEADGRAVDTGDGGPMIDTRARDAYRARARDLREQLEEAEAWNDPVRTEKVRSELEALEAELSRSIGLGGRPRRSGAATERARVNVQRRLKDVVRRLRAEQPDLARHLERSLRTGTHCVYDP